ncbi:unnamed protein product [Tuber melanosporum]|uniref:(Perigord truffle) hypothetical protein n=1 Tax=Tuber melanosporum (strain Mel28) TaxID=656061 RepID=D5GA72_TUBMM|nr:uncharacterized protein GSTUM_00005166001 [Tuber melanosporum]CAZ81426.1 unnamed protein product [Tuber melanosporum]
MPFGKIYSYPKNPRTTALLAVAKENGLEIEIVHEEPDKGVSAEFPLSRAMMDSFCLSALLLPFTLPPRTRRPLCWERLSRTMCQF